MKGSVHVPFNTLFADTVQTHGVEWARQHYTKGGMSEWEFDFWLKGVQA